MSIRKEDLDLDNPFNNFKLFWNAGKENWKNKDHIARLTVFYSKYHPSKLGSISTLLTKYEGRELEMYNNILKKYGVDALSPKDREMMENTYILMEYYKIHNPEKLSDVPSLIKKYEDDFDVLFAKMQKKYGIDPRTEIQVPKVDLPITDVKPATSEVQKDVEDDEYSEYSYDEDEKEKTFLQRKDGDNENIFSSLLKSSKKLLNELSTAGIKTDAKSPSKQGPVKADIGGTLIDNDVSLQNEINSRVSKSLADAVERVDSSMSELVGIMKTEDDLWQSLKEEISYDHVSMIGSYQTRLNSLVDRVRAIEIMLTNREEEVERESLEEWKKQKETKLGMLQEVYNKQIEEKKEELEDLQHTKPVEKSNVEEVSEDEDL
ncbi:hypothetical protein JH06_5261 [Blastocystis sp. subtype 4]|uniref:hypothetical protein n=1 Tax=Blastocystis sp. subtype 4 TaxID=944170 RepID=UPI000711BB33|nr:hypothetical protein JH06_5261 [Blastocystis sp. subtype 4]KNB41532.1 hypothetical protein JH06_5261 [Blastocystis sp. subtype 4]|eukprot:XP_014524975.1 hypothetical protein JH06_5261 [Blastocystis sp. subtype 4]